MLAMAADALTDLSLLLGHQFPQLPWPAATLQALLPRVQLRRLPAQAVVFAQGAATPALYGVMAGEVAIRLGTVDGAVSVVEHTQPMQLFGLASFASGLPATYEAITTRPSRLLVLGPAAYELLMDGVPGFARALMAEFARRHDATMRQLAAARHHGAMERLTLALDQMRREQPGRERDAQGWQRLRTTQAELAALAGLSRQTVNRLLAALVTQGRLRRAYGGLWLPPGGG